MARGAYYVASAPPRPDITPFLDDVRHNLIAARHAHGPGSSAYHHLVRHYRAVAATLECERELERLLHPLPGRYVRVKTNITPYLDQ